MEKNSERLGAKPSRAYLLLCVHVCESVSHLMLELARVSAAHRDHAAIHVQLTDNGHASFELRAEGLWRAAAQPQQTNQDVLLRVFIGEKGLPAAVGHIVSPYQLHLHTDICVREHQETTTSPRPVSRCE